MPQPYLNSLRRTLDEVAAGAKSFELKGQLLQLVASLIQRYEPEIVVLAGSLAEGRWVKGSSDIDLLVITGRAQSLAPPDRFHLSAIDGVDVSIAIYTREEVLAGISSLSFFILDAIDVGVPLYGRESFAKLRSTMEREAERLKLTKVKGGWTFQT